MLSPTSKGTTADQLAVPAAAPEAPVDVVHCTDATATLSVAVPPIVRDASEVLTRLNAGETIRNEGGVTSPAGVGCAEVAGAGSDGVDGVVCVAVEVTV